jgi:hypothetical protein
MITFATVGYSAYQEFNVLMSPETTSNLRTNVVIQNGVIRLDISGALPNRGLYPLDFSISLGAIANGVKLSSTDSQSITILPGQSKDFNISLIINPYASSSSPALLLNGSEIFISTGIRANLEPFAGIRIESGSNVSLPALMNNLKVGPANAILATNTTIINVPVSFENRANFPYSFSLYGILRGLSSSNEEVRSSTFSGNSLPAQSSNVTITFEIVGIREIRSEYPIELHILIFDNNITIQSKMQVKPT